MKKISIISVIISILTFVNAAYAQEGSFKHHSLGAGIGPTYGAGIIYRYSEEKFGIQAAALPYYNQDSALISAGVTGFYNLNRGRYGNLYLSFGVGTLFQKSTSYTSPEIDLAGTIIKQGERLPSEWKYGFATGPGIGFQIIFAENFSLNLEAPISFIFINERNRNLHLDRVGLWPNAALMYNF